MPPEPAPKPRHAKVRVNVSGSAPANTAAAEPVVELGAPSPQNQDDTLTPRDLRRARRKARRLGIEAANDHEAARILRARGIDLSARESVLDIVPDQSAVDPEGGLVNMPPEVMAAKAPTSAKSVPIDDAERIAEIAKIQRHLVRRRRLRLGLLLLKLAFFVLLPTALVGNYYYNTATDLFETSSEFVIQKAEASGASPVGGLFSGTGFATSQDSITVQGYLTSREAMLRLDQDHQFIAHYQQDWIDQIQRLDPEATLEEAFALFENARGVGYIFTGPYSLRRRAN